MTTITQERVGRASSRYKEIDELTTEEALHRGFVPDGPPICVRYLSHTYGEKRKRHITLPNIPDSAVACVAGESETVGEVDMPPFSHFINRSYIAVQFYRMKRNGE